MPGPKRSIVATLLAALIVLGIAAPAASAQPASVLVVGDSLEELTSPFLGKYLPGVKLTVNAVGGSNSFQIFDLFQESYEPSQSVVVFDAGTNDDPEYPQILAGNLAKVAAIVGPETCMVVPTIHGYTVNGVDNAGKNRVVREFAASRPGTQTPDWAGFEASHPELMQADGLHPIEAGAEARARLIAQGVLACLSGATSSSSVGRQRQDRPVEPRLAPVDAMQRRQSSLLGAIGMELGRQLAAVTVGGSPILAAAVSAASRE